MKNINLVLKILILVIIANISNSTRAVSNEYCGDQSINFTNKTINSKPVLFKIFVHKSDKFYKRSISAYLSKGLRIPKKFKKFQKAKITVYFSEDVYCHFESEIRIHGGQKDHIRNPYHPSLRVRLINGHVNHIFNFALIRKEARNFNEEIFITTFLKELKFLTPTYFKTEVQINGFGEKQQYLFVEMPSHEMAKDQNRNNGYFLSGNANNFEVQKTEKKFEKSLVLGRIKFSEPRFISNKNKEVLLNGLDKLNYLYINSLGIGDGKICCKDDQNIFSNLYSQGSYFLNMKNLVSDYERLVLFNLILKSFNAVHGLSLEDRVFYYDPMFDKIEPVYNDGDPNILNFNTFCHSLNNLWNCPISQIPRASKYKHKNYFIFESEKKFLNKTKDLIKSINTNNLQQNLSKNNLFLSDLQISKILLRIEKNLDLASKNIIKDYQPYLANNFFINHFDNKNLNFSLIFGGQKICLKFVQ